MKRLFFLFTTQLLLSSCSESYKKDSNNDVKLSGNDVTKLIQKELKLFNDLSNEFVFVVEFDKNQKEFGDSCFVEISVLKQNNNETVSKLHHFGFYFFDDELFSGSNIKSYLTQKNCDEDIFDNDFGDLIVADFNFDSHEDFAIKRDEGGNGGPLYCFYLNSKNKSFEYDPFLSEKMGWFPVKIDSKAKTLTTEVHASASSYQETIFRFNSILNKWKIQSQKIIYF